MFPRCKNDILGIRSDYSQPIRPLPETNRIPVNFVIRTGGQSGFFESFPSGRTKCGCPIHAFRMTLGETPDTGVTPLQEEKPVTTLFIGARQNNTRTNIHL